jgi:hypothetical protein
VKPEAKTDLSRHSPWRRRIGFVFNFLATAKFNEAGFSHQAGLAAKYGMFVLFLTFNFTPLTFFCLYAIRYSPYAIYYYTSDQPNVRRIPHF